MDATSEPQVESSTEPTAPAEPEPLSVAWFDQQIELAAAEAQRLNDAHLQVSASLSLLVQLRGIAQAKSAPPEATAAEVPG